MCLCRSVIRTHLTAKGCLPRRTSWWRTRTKDLLLKSIDTHLAGRFYPSVVFPKCLKTSYFAGTCIKRRNNRRNATDVLILWASFKHARRMGCRDVFWWSITQALDVAWYFWTAGTRTWSLLVTEGWTSWKFLATKQYKMLKKYLVRIQRTFPHCSMLKIDSADI